MFLGIKSMNFSQKWAKNLNLCNKAYPLTIIPPTASSSLTTYLMTQSNERTDNPAKFVQSATMTYNLNYKDPADIYFPTKNCIICWNV